MRTRKGIVNHWKKASMIGFDNWLFNLVREGRQTSRRKKAKFNDESQEQQSPTSADLTLPSLRILKFINESQTKYNKPIEFGDGVGSSFPHIGRQINGSIADSQHEDRSDHWKSNRRKNPQSGSANQLISSLKDKKELSKRQVTKHDYIKQWSHEPSGIFGMLKLKEELDLVALLRNERGRRKPTSWSAEKSALSALDALLNNRIKVKKGF